MPTSMTASSRALLPWLVAALLLGGCATVDRPPAVPEPLVGEATLPGYGNIRHIHGYREAEFIADYQLAMRSAPDTAEGVSILALSGGGPNGAFGAGALVGWTETGTRPQFQVVTGVSTGALAAPFAFLGPAYDTKLRNAYTSIHDDDVFVPHLMRSLFGMLHTDSLANTSAFNRTLADLVNAPMLAEIAAEYAKGRRLYVCTHEMVSGHAVYWNLTAIAASDNPGALDLFRRVLIASASVPIVFPPEYFEVEAGGKPHTEIHMDGGLSRQVFFHMNGARAGLRQRPDGTPTPLTAYIIRNGKLRTPYHELTPRVMNIALRTVQSLVAAEGIGDLYRIYSQTLEEQAAYRLMMIPEDFPTDHQGMFDPEFMRRLFDLGQATIKAPQPWQHQPPFLSSTDGL